jgi:uncharacterized protein involved in exopolysaccharide biosynthesis
MLADLQVHYTDQYPEVRRMKARLEQLEKQEAQAALSAAKAAEGSSSSSEVVDAGPDPPAGPSEPLAQVRAKIGELKLQLEGANKELGSRQADRQRILADLASYQRRVENLPLREQDMASLKRDYDISKGNYESLLRKSLEADMASDMEKRQKAEQFNVLDAARVPEKPVKPPREILYAVAILVSIALSLVYPLLRELRANVLLGEWELPEDVTILGRVPKITGAQSAGSKAA